MSMLEQCRFADLEQFWRADKNCLKQIKTTPEYARNMHTICSNKMNGHLIKVDDRFYMSKNNQ